MLFALLAGIVGAIWAHRVAAAKGHTSVMFAVGGFLFPLIGVLFAYVAYPAPPKTLT